MHLQVRAQIIFYNQEHLRLHEIRVLLQGQQGSLGNTLCLALSETEMILHNVISENHQLSYKPTSDLIIIRPFDHKNSFARQGRYTSKVRNLKPRDAKGFVQLKPELGSSCFHGPAKYILSFVAILCTYIWFCDD